MPACAWVSWLDYSGLDLVEYVVAYARFKSIVYFLYFFIVVSIGVSNPLTFDVAMNDQIFMEVCKALEQLFCVVDDHRLLEGTVLVQQVRHTATYLHMHRLNIIFLSHLCLVLKAF